MTDHQPAPEAVELRAALEAAYAAMCAADRWAVSHSADCGDTTCDGLYSEGPEHAASVKAGELARAALARQAPAALASFDKGPWSVTETGNVQSDDFKHDVTLGISGDFASKDERIRYGQALADALNSRHPQPQAVTEDARDGERYRWLRSGTHTRQSKELRDRGGRHIDKSETMALMSFNFWCTPEELDTAIDAAMTKEIK